MCNAPKIPAPPPPPPPPQAAKAPLGYDPKRRKNNVMGGGFAPTPGGTLLTGPTGAGAPATGSTTLLGG